MQNLTLDKLPTPVLLVWGLPEYYKEFNENVLAFIYNGIARQKLSGYDWQLIGKLSELTEDDCQELVKETHLYRKLNVRSYRFTSYINGFIGFQFASDSFHSAIEAEGYHMVNPIGEKPELKYSDYLFAEQGASESLLESIHENYEQELSKWKEAQSKTLPANTLIFKRV